LREPCPLVGARPSGCYNGVLLGPGVGALRQPPRLQSGDTFGILPCGLTISCATSSLNSKLSTFQASRTGSLVSKSVIRDPWTKKINYCLVKYFTRNTQNSRKRTHFVCACHPDSSASVACASAYFSLIYIMFYRGSAKVCGVCVRYIKLFSIQQKHHPAVISYFCLL
jgi:hypothetical protein